MVEQLRNSGSAIRSKCKKQTRMKDVYKAKRTIAKNMIREYKEELRKNGKNAEGNYIG